MIGKRDSMLYKISQVQNSPQQPDWLATQRYPYSGNTPSIQDIFPWMLVRHVNLNDLATVAFYQQITRG